MRAMGDDVVDRPACRDAAVVTPGFTSRHQQVQHLGGQPAGPAHALEILRLVQRHREMGALARGFEHLGFGHERHVRWLWLDA